MFLLLDDFTCKVTGLGGKSHLGACTQVDFSN